MFFSWRLKCSCFIFDPLYLQVIQKQSPEFSGLVLFAIPISVFLVAFMVGWLIHRLGIMNTMMTGLAFAIFASFLQLFLATVTPLWYIITGFICSGAMWAMGNSVSLIAAQAAVDPTRSSVATGTMVILFNVGGSIGLAIAVVVYHAMGLGKLKDIFLTHAQLLNTTQLSQLENLISNPAQLLTGQINSLMHFVFNEAFMHGFKGVMIFLLILSSLIIKC